MRWELFVALSLASCRGEEVQPTAIDAAPEAPPADDVTDARAEACARAHGPTMVRVDATSASYCIDTTEVTVGQLNEFLAAPGGPFEAPPFCASFADARPARNDAAAEQSLPARNVQWCWAHAYCKWAGKRLCGTIGRSGYDVPSDGRSEWTFACQNGKLATRYPYGTAYVESTCNTTPGSLQSVGAAVDCHGQGAPFDRISDMLGNVAELDGFVGFLAAGEAFTVRSRGWAYGDGAHDCSERAEYGFGTTWPQTGFRCCADP
ncbi:MAG: SUMF1/EgtB/PvdO family nonheme iron enzyme [Deltaproteobacteria bacterium]|nr:SUMF1/EgtB/PvdO family nonheme iron enzyme [Deltaproteobacteria bacterium]